MPKTKSRPVQSETVGTTTTSRRVPAVAYTRRSTDKQEASIEEQKRQTVILVDEAHNLVDRAREMYSSKLNKSDYLAVQREFKGVNPEVHDAAKAINRWVRKRPSTRQTA